MAYRVSNVEAFRKWEADPEGDTDRLICDILGTSDPSPLMEAGTAFHAMLQHATPGTVSYATSMEHSFSFDQDFEVELPQVRELRARKTWIVDDQPIVITGQVDAIDGKVVIDHKTTGRFDPERYMAGAQWKLYLSIFGADRFVWNVFEMVQVESVETAFGFDAPMPHFEIFAQHRLEQFRYPEMEADCTALVSRFARFVRETLEAEVPF